uniref:Transmembrane protein 147 n=1 Tax=Rhabditophanes sp. KR3021 TaxID=114890 RepID=A0AC35TY80_9BILA
MGFSLAIICLSLSYLPYVFLFMYSGILDHVNVWKFFQSAFAYALTQFLKLMVIATFFPESDADHFDLSVEIMKSSVDIFDMMAFHFLIYYIYKTKGEIAVLASGIGWSLSHAVTNYFITFIFIHFEYVFNWKWIILACEVQINFITSILGFFLFQHIIYLGIQHSLDLSHLAVTIFKGVITAVLMYASLRIYARSPPSKNKIY